MRVIQKGSGYLDAGQPLLFVDFCVGLVGVFFLLLLFRSSLQPLCKELVRSGEGEPRPRKPLGLVGPGGGLQSGGEDVPEESLVPRHPHLHAKVVEGGVQVLQPHPPVVGVVLEHAEERLAVQLPQEGVSAAGRVEEKVIADLAEVPVRAHHGRAGVGGKVQYEQVGVGEGALHLGLRDAELPQSLALLVAEISFQTQIFVGEAV